MKDVVYLIFTNKRVVGLRRTKAPALRPGEYTAKLTVVVPNKFFDDAIPQAVLTVSENSIWKAPLDVTTIPIEVVPSLEP